MPPEPTVSLRHHTLPSCMRMSIVFTRWCEYVDDRRPRRSYDHPMLGIRGDCDDITGAHLTALPTQRHFQGAFKHDTHLLMGVIVWWNDACRIKPDAGDHLAVTGERLQVNARHRILFRDRIPF
jgi:hypothetical protein